MRLVFVMRLWVAPRTAPRHWLKYITSYNRGFCSDPMTDGGCTIILPKLNAKPISPPATRGIGAQLLHFDPIDKGVVVADYAS